MKIPRLLSIPGNESMGESLFVELGDLLIGCSGSTGLSVRSYEKAGVTRTLNRTSKENGQEMDKKQPGENHCVFCFGVLFATDCSRELS